MNPIPSKPDRDFAYAKLRSEVRAVRRDIRALWTLFIGLTVWLFALSCMAAPPEYVLEDAQRFKAAPYYLSFVGTDPERRADLEAAVLLAVSSLTRVISLDSVLPVPVGPDYWRLDIERLGWSELPAILQESYPYGGLEEPYCIRADWFVTLLDQSSEIDAYFRLLLGQQITNIQQFFDAFGIVAKSPDSLGWIEERSRVAHSGIRLIQNRPTTGRETVWTTYDSERIDRDHDPLEHLLGGFQYEASEHIALMPKQYRGFVGHLQAYALSNAAGDIQSEAPAAIVADFNQVRGVPIRNAISCVVCHAQGLQPLSESGLRAYVESGAEVYVDPHRQPDVERLYLSDLQRMISRSNEDFNLLVSQITGMETAVAVGEAVQRVITAYDAPVSIEVATREIGVTSELINSALQTFNESARASILPSRPIPRAAFEDLYPELTNACFHLVTDSHD